MVVDGLLGHPNTMQTFLNKVIVSKKTSMTTVLFIKLYIGFNDFPQSVEIVLYILLKCFDMYLSLELIKT